MVVVNKINRSGNLANKLCWEGNVINKAYRSGELIYQRIENNYEEYGESLSFEIISGGSIYWKNIYYEQFGTYTPQDLYYKINNGAWNKITSTGEGTSFNVNTGDFVQFKGNYYITTPTEIPSFCGTTATFNACGNVMSLVYGDNFQNKTILDAGKQFDDLFFRCNTLINANRLIIPATTLSYGCYQGMFRYCTNLLSAPALPATNLTELCYNGMFIGCSSLTTAPELPATTLAPSCYLNMFGDCTSLNYIKCLATDISATNCVYIWTQNISAAGTFIKSPDMSGWTTGASGIPTGWTVIDAE